MHINSNFHLKKPIVDNESCDHYKKIDETSQQKNA